MSGLGDLEIYRIYECTEEDCGCEIGVVQTAKEGFIKECPECSKETLVMKSGKANMSIFIDPDKPKTLGMQGQMNRREQEANGTQMDPVKKKPWWRSKYKIDYDILKNPKRYIETGKK